MIIDLYRIDLKTLVDAYYNNDYLLKEKLIELIISVKNTDIKISVFYDRKIPLK